MSCRHTCKVPDSLAAILVCMRYWPAIIPLSAVLAALVGCGRNENPAPAAPVVAPPPPVAALLLSWDFAGAEALRSDTNVATFGEVASLPESHAFAEATVRQFAAQIAAPLLSSDPTNAPA